MNKIDELCSIFAQTAHIYHQWSRQNQIQYAELAVLYMLMRYQPCSQKHICQAWLLPKQTVSTVCKQFHAQGWLQFTPSAHDKREKIMTLTPVGLAHAQPLITPLIQAEQQALQQFGNERTEHLLTELNTFTSLLIQQLTP